MLVFVLGIGVCARTQKNTGDLNTGLSYTHCSIMECSSLAYIVSIKRDSCVYEYLYNAHSASQRCTV